MNAEDRISTYLKHLNRALGALPEPDRSEIVAETRSHLRDRLAGGESELDRALSAFGAPEDYARQFIEDYKLSRALASGRAAPLYAEVLARAGRSILGFAGTALFGLAYLAAFCFLLVAAIKPLFPDRVGVWVGENVLGLGVVDAATAKEAQELLGYWVIPLGLVCGIALYVLTTRLLRHFLKSFIK